MALNRGFTLVELLVILAIVGVLVAVAAPSLSETMARRRLEGVANELQADMQYTKTQASSSNSTVQLVTSATGYTVGTSVTPAMYKTITLSSRFALTSGVTVAFEPYRGFPAAAASITVTNADTPAQLTIKVDAKGVIQMCSPNALVLGYVAC